MATKSTERKERPTAIQTKDDGGMKDAAWPNEAWSDVAKEIFHRLNAGTADGDWQRHPGLMLTGDRRVFSRNILEQGKGFEFAIFINKKKQRATSVCQFGPYLEGGPSQAHGGALLTILDEVIGMCASYVMGTIALTANLNINFKSPIRLGSTALFHAKVDKIEGRKCYLSAHVTSADGRTTLCEATALYIQPSHAQSEEFKKNISQDSPVHIRQGAVVVKERL